MEANGEMGSEMKIYIGAENVVSPLGLDIVENFNNAFLGLSGLKSLQNPYPKIKQLFASSFPKAFEGQESKIEKIDDFKKDLLLFSRKDNKNLVNIIEIFIVKDD